MSWPAAAERIPGQSDIDTIGAELTLARRYASSGRLSEASDIVTRLTGQLGAYIASGEAPYRVSHAALSHDTPSRYTGEPSWQVASPADTETSEMFVTKARLLMGSSWAVRGNVEDRAGQHDSAQDAYANAVLNFEAVDRAALDGHELSDLGMALLGTDRPGDALSALRESIERGAWTAQSFRYLGLTLLRENNTDEAETNLRRAVELDPDDPWLRSDLAGAISARASGGQEAATLYNDAAIRHAEAGRAEAALADFDRALGASPGYVSALTGKAATLLAVGKAEEGLAAAELGLQHATGAVAETGSRQDMDAVLLRRFRAEALRLLGRNDEALAEIDQLLAGDDEDAWLLAEKGMIVSQLGREDDAELLLRQALTIDPGLDWARQSLAEALRLANRHDDAIAVLDEALARNPEDAWSLATKGQVLSAQGHQGEAAVLLRQALAIDPANNWARRSLADAFLLAGHYDEALPVLDELLATMPRDAQVLGIKGQALLAQDRHDEAAESLRQSISIDPGLDWARQALAEALRLADRPDDALVVLDEALARNPEDAWSLATKGQVLSAQGHQDEAAILLRQALGVDPALDWARRVLAEALRLTGRTDDALAVLDEALGRNPDDEETLTAKAGILLDRNQPDQAAALLRTRAATSTSTVLHAMLAEALRLLNQLGEALTECERALEFDSDNASAWASKGAVLQGLLRHDEALEALDQAIQIDPRYDWALGAKASVLFDLAEFEPILELLDKAATVEQVTEWALIMKSVALRMLGRAGEALNVSRQALELPGSTADVRPALAEALLGVGQDDEAAEQYRWYLTYQSEHGTDPTPVSLANIGWAHYRLGEYRDAIASLGEALSRDPQQLSSRFDLGLVFLCAGQARLATDTYQTALDDLGIFTALRKHALIHVAQFDLDDASARYKPDHEVVAEISRLLKEGDQPEA